MSVRRERREHFKEFLIGLMIIGLMEAALYPAVRMARHASRRSQQCSHLHQIGIALHHFHDIHKSFPSAVQRDQAGRPLASWRFQIAPFLETITMNADFGAKWDVPANRWLTFRAHRVFCLYAGSGQEKTLRARTNFVAVTGAGTVFENGRTWQRENIDSDTILVIEVPSSDTLWAEPGDLDVDQLPENLTKGPAGNGFHVLFADGAVWYLRSEVPLAEVRKFFTVDGAKQYERRVVLGPYATFSGHGRPTRSY